MNILLVACGGAVGAVLRYLISLIPLKTEYPVLTLVTNFLGAVLIGFVVGLLSCGKLTKSHALFLKTGVCGGFTTFSTFSLETVQLFEQGKLLSGCSYIGLSLALCLMGVVLGSCLAGAIQKA